MARPFTFAGVELDVRAGEAAAVAEPEPLPLNTDSEQPFRILVLGDFSGDGEGSPGAVRVHSGNLDGIMRSLHVRTTVSITGDPSCCVGLEAIEHFEPDSLFERCDIFRRAECVPEKDSEELMRAILHDPGFQALEAAWRSLDFLVRGIDDDDRIQVYVLDIPKQKLAAELAQASGFRDTAVYQIIVEQPASSAGAGLWSLIAGNYSFDRSSAEDVDLLTTLGLLARSARAPFLAEVLPYPGGERAALESWLALRQSAYASWVGLAIPRLLLRLPYGKDTRVVEAFDFEEMPGMPRHTDYLWGNPAFACASLIARSFAEVGGSFRPGMHLELERLPLHVYKVGAETRVQPCAELLLSERDQEELLRQGLIPLTWVKGRDSARLIRFQSIADPPAALSGRWS